MVDIIKINDSITIEIKKSDERTIITLNRNGKNIILSDLYTDSTFTSNVVYDNNYIVVYSKGDERNQIPIEIECAYNIKNGIILDTKNNSKLSDDLYMMLIDKKMFSAGSIVIWLNQKDLELGYEDETARIIEYLTNVNNNISREEIVDYVLKEYPILSNYLDLNLDACKKVISDVSGECLFFHKMSQIIDSEKGTDIELCQSNNKPYHFGESISNVADARRRALEFRQQKLEGTRVR